MSPEDFDIEHVAELARIKLSPEEVATFRAQLGNVLDHVAKLNELNVAGVEPTAHSFPLYNVFRPDEVVEPTAHSFPLYNVFRPDEVRPSLPMEEALANAPHQVQGLFVVTKVLD
jgi:aspartyl-tRNA(Asn)/glutamyl-tRNA(Gln) amidotransferase subunit C